MISPIDFLREIHPNPDERICLICIYPDDRRKNMSTWEQKRKILPVDVDESGKFIYRPHPLYIPINLWINRKDLLGKLSLLHALNKRDWGVYYSVSGFGEKLNKWGRPARDRENVRRIQVLFADFDESTDASRSLEAGQGFDLLPPPNYLVHTSENKLQVIWLTERSMTFETAESALLYISTKTEGDPAVKDLSRVLRLPGFKNTKLKSNEWPVTAEKLHDRRLKTALVETIAAAGRSISASVKPSTSHVEERTSSFSSARAVFGGIPASAPLNLYDIGPVAIGRALQQWGNIYRKTKNKTLADWGLCCYLRGLGVREDTMLTLLKTAHSDDGSKGNDEYYKDTIQHCLEQGREELL